MDRRADGRTGGRAGIVAGGRSCWNATVYNGSLRPLGEPSGRAASLVCCPHAGGTAAFFRSWPAHFPPDIQIVPVQYPGHGDRLDESCLDDVHELSALLAAEVADLPGLILLGHSFGAAVAFETAVRLSAAGMPPLAVYISARDAPHHDLERVRPPRTDAAIWQEMERLGGTPPEITATPEWRELLTPILRADFHADADYRPSRTRLPCPITVLLGEDDVDLSAASIETWREYTAAEFAVRVFPGGHFYLADHVPAIAAQVAGQVAALRSSSPRAGGDGAWSPTSGGTP
ncbi:thioesterase II family protein [Microtetraspora malaysiensis]|uniref:thioesterase II family protein n=1 Tax=Microtetraspora malaysiensis TaxID=161358 RepID=UPI003D8B9A60